MGMGKMRKFGKKLPTQKKVINTVNRVLDRRIETKEYPFGVWNQQTVDYNGQMSNRLCAPVQGDGWNERVGDQISPMTMSVKTTFVCAATTNACRLIIFKWRVDDITTAPTAAALFATGYLGTALAPYAPFRHDAGKKDFEVIYDKFYMLSETTREVTQDIRTIKLKGKIYFNDAAITGKYHYYALALSDDGAVSYPGITLVTNIRYKDA